VQKELIAGKIAAKSDLNAARGLGLFELINIRTCLTFQAVIMISVIQSDLVSLMRKSHKPLLASIRGVATGGGLEMTLHCDVLFAAGDARLGQPEVNVGFIPSVGAMQALARLIGRTAALRYLCEGTLVNAEEALKMGLKDDNISGLIDIK